MNLDVRKPAASSRIALGTFDASKLPAIGGFRLDGRVDISFVAGYRTEAATHLALPNVFSASPGSDDKITGDVTLSADNASALRLDGVDVTVPRALMGVLEVRDLSFSYRRADDVWEGAGSILFGPSGVRLDMKPPPTEYGVGFKNGGLSHAGGEVSFGSSAPAIFPGVFLQKIRFAIGTKPTVLRGGITLGVGKAVEVDADVFVALASPQEPYTFRDPPAPLARFRNTTFTGTAIAAAGAVALRLPVLGRVPFASGYFLYADGEDPFIAAGGGIDFSVLGAFGIKGEVNGEFGLDNGRFNVSGDVSACIKHVPIKGDLCLGVSALISSEGIVACGDLGLLEAGRRLSLGRLDRAVHLGLRHGALPRERARPRGRRRRGRASVHRRQRRVVGDGQAPGRGRPAARDRARARRRRVHDTGDRVGPGQPALRVDPADR